MFSSRPEINCVFFTEKCSKVDILRKRFSQPPVGVEPMTFQKYWLDALTTELWETCGEQGHILGSCSIYVIYICNLDRTLHAL